MALYQINVLPQPNQELTANLTDDFGNVYVLNMSLRTLPDNKLYATIEINDEIVVMSRRCIDRQPLLLNDKVQGNIYFADAYGDSDPVYTELNSRYLLIYDTANEFNAVLSGGIGVKTATSDTGEESGGGTSGGSVSPLDEYATKGFVYEQVGFKQDKLIAGENISIVNNTISSNITSIDWGNLTGDISNQTDLETALNNKAEIDLGNITDNAKVDIVKYVCPSNAYTQLSIVPSGGTYTAPANGYFYATYTASNNSGYCNIYNQSTYIRQGLDTSRTNASAYLMLQVLEGQTIAVTYGNGSLTTARFIYAEGTKQ